ncbi:hypothetical protein Pmani_016645 [Petrolisthes manimaculis]|uniref:Uncharacterized protein n=1 Tax=Petrolisthes manimaculis TaxID=1843537 RepID=A0AAE1UAA9_9EUCA|nr:hypothetical protein Pmani_016645 [Petrolisthes manimaculis]
MDALAEELTIEVLPQHQLQNMVKKVFATGKKDKNTDYSWFGVVKLLIDKITIFSSTVFFENVSQIIQLNINETLKRGLKHPEQHGKLYYAKLNKLLRHLNYSVEHVDLPIAELKKLTAHILAAIIDMEAVIVRKGNENAAVKRISTRLDHVFNYSQEHKLDTLLQCRTLVFPKTRQPQIFLPMLKQLILTTVNRRPTSPHMYLKVLLLAKLWLFMTKKEKTLYGGTAVATKGVSTKKIKAKKRAFSDSSENSASISEQTVNLKDTAKLNKKVKISKVLENDKDLSNKLCTYVGSDGGKKKKNKAIRVKREISEKHVEVIIKQELPSVKKDGMKQIPGICAVKRGQNMCELDTAVENCRKKKRSNTDDRAVREGHLDSNKKINKLDIPPKEVLNVNKKDHKDDKANQRGQLDINKISKIDIASEKTVGLKKKERLKINKNEHQLDIVRGEVKAEKEMITEKREPVKELKATEGVKVQKKKATEKRETMKELQATEVKIQMLKKATEKRKLESVKESTAVTEISGEKAQQFGITRQEQKRTKGKSNRKKAGVAKNTEKICRATAEEKELPNKGEAAEGLKPNEKNSVKSKTKPKAHQTPGDVCAESEVKCKANNESKLSLDLSFKNKEIYERAAVNRDLVTIKKGKAKTATRMEVLDGELKSTSSVGTPSHKLSLSAVPVERSDPLPNKTIKEQLNSHIAIIQADKTSTGSSFVEKGIKVAKNNKKASVAKTRPTKEPLVKSSESALVRRKSSGKRNVFKERPNNHHGSIKQWNLSFRVTEQSAAVEEIEPKTLVRRKNDGEDNVQCVYTNIPRLIQKQALNPVVDKITDSNNLDGDPSGSTSSVDDVVSKHLGDRSADLDTVKEESKSLDGSECSDDSESDSNEITLHLDLEEEVSSSESDSVDSENAFTRDIKEESSSEDETDDDGKTVNSNIKEESESDSDTTDRQETVKSKIQREELSCESDSDDGGGRVNGNIKEEASSESDTDDSESSLIRDIKEEEEDCESDSADGEEAIKRNLKVEPSSDEGEMSFVKYVKKEIEESSSDDSDEGEKSVNSYIKEEQEDSNSEDDSETSFVSDVKEEKLESSSEGDSDEGEKSFNSNIKEEQEDSSSESDSDDCETSFVSDVKEEKEESSSKGIKSINNNIKEDNDDGEGSVESDIEEVEVSDDGEGSVESDKEEDSEDDSDDGEGSVESDKEEDSEDDSDDGEGSIESDVQEIISLSDSDNVDTEETSNINNINNGHKRSKRESSSHLKCEQPIDSDSRNLEEKQSTKSNNEKVIDVCNSDVGELETSVQELNEIILVNDGTDCGKSECNKQQITESSHQRSKQHTRTSPTREVANPTLVTDNNSVVVDLDSDIEIIEDNIEDKIPLKKCKRKRRNYHSDIDEASGSDTDIVPCDEGRPIFTDEEIKDYHSKLTAGEIQRKVESMIKQEVKQLKSKHLIKDINQELEGVDGKEQPSRSCLDINTILCNLYKARPAKEEPQRCNSEHVEQYIEASTSNLAEIKSITSCQLHRDIDKPVDHNDSNSFKDKEAEEDDSIDHDSTTDIEFVLQTILRDTGRVSSILGVRERLLRSTDIKEEEDSECENDPEQEEESEKSTSIQKNVEHVLTTHSNHFKENLEVNKKHYSNIDSDTGIIPLKETTLKFGCDTDNFHHGSETEVVENSVDSELKIDNITELGKNIAINKCCNGFNIEQPCNEFNIDHDKIPENVDTGPVCGEGEVQSNGVNLVSKEKESKESEEYVVKKENDTQTSEINPVNEEKEIYSLNEDISINGNEEAPVDEEKNSVCGEEEAQVGNNGEKETYAIDENPINIKDEDPVSKENLINGKEMAYTNEINPLNGEKEVHTSENIINQEKDAHVKEIITVIEEKEANVGEGNSLDGEEEAHTSDDNPVKIEEDIHTSDGKITNVSMVKQSEGNVYNGDNVLSNSQYQYMNICKLEKNRVEIQNIHCNSDEEDVKENIESMHSAGGIGDIDVKDFEEITKEEIHIDDKEVNTYDLFVDDNRNTSASENNNVIIKNIRSDSDAEDENGKTESMHSDGGIGEDDVEDSEEMAKEEIDIDNIGHKEINHLELLIDNDCNQSASEKVQSDCNVCCRHVVKNDLILNGRIGLSPFEGSTDIPVDTENTPQKSYGAVVIPSETESIPKGSSTSTCNNTDSIDEECETKSLDETDDAYEASSDGSEDSTPVVKKRLRNLRKNTIYKDLPEVSDSEPFPVEKKRRKRTVGTCGVACQKLKKKRSQSCCSETDSLLTVQVPLSGHNLSKHDAKNNIVLSDSEIVCRKSVSKHICSTDKIQACTEHTEVREYESLGLTAENNGKDCDVTDVNNDPVVPQGSEKVSISEVENLNDVDVLNGFNSSKRNWCLAINEDLNEVPIHNFTENIDEGEELEVLSTSEVEEKDELSCSDSLARNYDDASEGSCCCNEMKIHVSPKLLTCQLGHLSRLNNEGKKSSPESFKLQTHVIPHRKVHHVLEAVLNKEVLISPEVSDEECELMSPTAYDNQEMERSLPSQVDLYSNRKRLTYVCGRKRYSGGIRSPQKVIPEEQDESTLPKHGSNACVNSSAKGHSRSRSLERSKLKNLSPTRTPSRGSPANRQIKVTENRILESDLGVPNTPKNLVSTSHKQELPVSPVPLELSSGEEVRENLRSNRTLAKTVSVNVVKDNIPLVKEIGFSNVGKKQPVNIEEKTVIGDDGGERNGTQLDDRKIDLNREQWQAGATRRLTGLLRRSNRLKSKSSEDESTSVNTTKLSRTQMRASPRSSMSIAVEAGSASSKSPSEAHSQSQKKDPTTSKPSRSRIITRAIDSSLEVESPKSSDNLDASVHHNTEKEDIVSFSPA